jgi:GDP-L-fucose synthase
MTATSFWTDKRVLVTGGAGFLGTRLVALLDPRGPGDIRLPRSSEHDLRERASCRDVVRDVHVVIHLAANVGGIGYNLENPSTLFFDNLMMGALLMEEARLAGIEKFVGIGTICSYPKFTPVPFREDDLWSGYPEESNAAYGLSKKMLLVQGQAARQQYGFNAIYLLPTNLYGPRDNFETRSSHVIPALIRKVLEAKDAGRPQVEVWGTGSATRDFLYVDDAAEGILLAAERYDAPEALNLGSGTEISIRDLAELIVELCDYEGELVWDSSKPDGQPRRMVDASRARQAFGFRANTDFRSGLRRTIEWFVSRRAEPAQAIG